MVNLKEYLLEATAAEEKFPELLAGLRKYIARGDEDFVGKFAGALRDAVREKGASARQKYLCLQAVNVGLQARSPLFAEAVEEKLLERLFLMAMFESKVPEADGRGRRLLRQFDETADEEDSAKFYALLLECFALWGQEPLTPAFAAKHAMLAKNVALPAARAHLFLYTEVAEGPRAGSAGRRAEEPPERAAAPRPNPFYASADEQLPAAREAPSPEDIRAVSAYAQRERAELLRRIAVLEEEGRRAAEERRRADVRVAALEAELVARDGRVAALEGELRATLDLGGSYIREGLEHFRRAAAPRPADLSPAPARLSAPPPRPHGPAADDALRGFPPPGEEHSVHSTRLKSLYEMPAASLKDISSVKAQFSHTSDFMANFNADIASILNRKSTLPEVPGDADFSRRRPESGFGLSQTLDLGPGKGRAQSSRLQEYVRKYTADADAALFEAAPRKEPPAAEYRGRPEAQRPPAHGILRYKNY